MRFKQVTHAIFYDWDTAKKNAYMQYVERKIIREKKKKPLFYKMLQIAKKTIKHYQSDFYVHDYNYLTIERSGNRYLWIVYDCGSHLIRLDSDFKEEMEHAINYFQYFKHHKEETAKIFIVDLKNQTLKQTKIDDIKSDYFSYKYNDYSEYVNKVTSKLNIKEVLEVNKQIKQILNIQRNYISKKQIDEIITNIS